jgi:hypothetical protein
MGEWEFPIMEVVTKLDSRRRGVFPSPFQPGDILVRDAQDADRVTFRLIKPGEVECVEVVTRGGRTMLPPGRAGAAMIAAAIRAERDAR